MEMIHRFNGNKQPYSTPLPRLCWLTQTEINDVALAWVEMNTGLKFEKCCGGYDAQPEASNQIAALFVTYNFKTQYHNNGSTKNTLFLKSDHHQGFHVDSICYECVKYNHIHLGGLKEGDRLAC